MEAALADATRAVNDQATMWETGSLETLSSIESLDSDGGASDLYQFSDGDDGVADAHNESLSSSDGNGEEAPDEDAPEAPAEGPDALLASKAPYRQPYGSRKGQDGNVTRVDIDQAFKLRVCEKWEQLKTEHTLKGKLRHGTFSLLSAWVTATSKGKFKVCRASQVEMWCSLKGKGALERSKKRCRQPGAGTKVLDHVKEATMKGYVTGLREAFVRVTVQKLFEKARDVYGKDMSRGWMQKFLSRNKLRVKSVKRNTPKSTEEIHANCQSFLEKLHGVVGSGAVKFVLNFDEVPMSLSGNMSRGLSSIALAAEKDIRISFDAADTKRCATVILGAAVNLETRESFPLKPFLLLKGSPKRESILNEVYDGRVAVCWTECGVITGKFMLKYAKHIAHELQNHNGGAEATAAVILDSARAHYSATVVKAFHAASLIPVRIPGGCTSWIQFVDTDLAFVYRTKHLGLYFKATPVIVKRSQKQKRHLLADITARATNAAFESVGIVRAFVNLGYLDPTSVRLRTDKQFVYVPKEIDVDMQLDAIRDAIRVGKQQAVDEIAVAPPPPPTAKQAAKRGPKPKVRVVEVPAKNAMLTAWLLPKPKLEE